MSTVVQRTYAPQIRPALVGNLAGQGPHDVITRLCQTAAGIPFGVAVSQGSEDQGVVIGGASKFVGVSVRDITLSRSPVDPLSDTANPLDEYGYYTNMAILTRGRMWVAAQANVAPFDALYYDATTGLFTNSASGAAAQGYIQFSEQPQAGQTIVVNGVTITFQASGASGDDVNLGATLGDTVAALATHLEASVTGGLAACHFLASPPSPGGSAEGSGADTLLISAAAAGVAGNAYALDVPGCSVATASGSTMSRGTASTNQVKIDYDRTLNVAPTPSKATFRNSLRRDAIIIRDLHVAQ